MAAGFRHEGEDEVYRGHIIRLARGRFRAPDGTSFTRDVVRHPGAVAIVPVVGDEFVLVRQYRGPIDAELLELPAGLRDVADEPPAETARRELLEETGFVAGRIDSLVRYFGAAGFTDEEMEIFLARDLTESARAGHGIEEQHMTVERVPVDDALGLIEKGELRDAKTIVGLLLALRHLGT